MQVLRHNVLITGTRHFYFVFFADKISTNISPSLYTMTVNIFVRTGARLEDENI